MDSELEAAAADAVTSAGRGGKHAVALGTPCANCATPLQGAWCHACGQKAADFHRSIGHAITEAFEGLTHFDGRFWNTLPRLIFNPGRLTRDYLDGHRIPQIPPFRLFLVVLLLVFLAGGTSFKPLPAGGVPITEAAAASQEIGQAITKAGPDAEGARWLAERVSHALQEPEGVLRAMEHWSHRFAILMLPIAALLLSVIFAFRRGVYVFDHLIFSMHSLSFLGLLLSAAFLLGLVVDWAGVLLLAAPVHLYRHMRGVYGTGRIGTLLRMSVLFLGSTVGFAILIVGLLIVGLTTAH